MLKVLIVEDDLLIAAMCQQTLIRAGYEVCGIARTVTDAVDKALRHIPDLALIDVGLGRGGQGTDIPAKLHALRDLGVLYCTGNASKTLMTGATGHGWLSKPYDNVTLLRALKIVSEMVMTGTVSRPLPYGFQTIMGRNQSVGHPAP